MVGCIEKKKLIKLYKKNITRVSCSISLKKSIAKKINCFCHAGFFLEKKELYSLFFGKMSHEREIIIVAVVSETHHSLASYYCYMLKMTKRMHTDTHRHHIHWDWPTVASLTITKDDAVVSHYIHKAPLLST